MPPAGSTRVLMYSHDTYGLGHLTRTLRVASAMTAQDRRISVLILTGSPVAPYMPVPRGADMVKLPSVVKIDADCYRARDLRINFKRIKKMRTDLIRSTALSFRPHLFLVDNVPLGMKGEVLPTLEAIRAHLPQTRIVLIMRDILDAPDRIRKTWEENGVRPVLESFYDRIVVLGDPAIHDSISAYGLPREKSVHLGYAVPRQRTSAHTGPLGDLPRILVSAGGGQDGAGLLWTALEALAPAGRREKNDRIRLELVTGPLLDLRERRALQEACRDRGARLHEFVPDVPAKMAQSDLVISMAGYNTCCEILSCARRALLVPRVEPRLEQWIRAKALESRGLVRTIHPDALRPDFLSRTVRSMLQAGPEIETHLLPRMSGLQLLPGELLGPAEECISSRPDHVGGQRSRGRQDSGAAPPVAPGISMGSSPHRIVGHGRSVFYWPSSLTAGRTWRQ